MLRTSVCTRKGRRRQADYPGLGVLYTRLQLPKTQGGNISVGFLSLIFLQSYRFWRCIALEF